MMTIGLLRSLQTFRHIPDLECHFDDPLEQRTSMKMRCRAGLLAIAHTPTALRAAMLHARKQSVPFLMLGGGSNTLFTSSQFDGVVCQLGAAFQCCDLAESELLAVGAGTDFKRVAKFAQQSVLGGLEFSLGIPGTVGGAAAGNAGAADRNNKQIGICDYIERALIMDGDGEIHDLQRGQFVYDYRRSQLRDFIIMYMELRLAPSTPERIKEEIAWFGTKRKGQPYSDPSCGCIFRNPIDPETNKLVSAGKLIDELGLKGYRIGGAAISEKHANFMINPNCVATGEDFLALINVTRDHVRDLRGIDLNLEVQIVSEREVIAHA